ncbi:PaaI family thioesterase [Oceanibaculum pacificum]|uniref:Thioesterase n=1 Tax=Oceanibaculum pacificum TaxID=580166 RepID=A0A154WET7_9PROT|nr:PaaI family thioesterase [Oceanibaculum pacificum]KZD12043.1 thioesterase [Oceanibaculum pacificum]
MALVTAQELDRIAREEVPYVGQLGVRFESVGDGVVTARLPFRDDLLRPGGTITGPAMMGLADIVMYGCVLSRIGVVKLAVTTNLTANFLKRPKPGDLIAQGRLLKCGKRLAYGEVSIFSEGDGEPVCHVTSTYSIPPRESGS